MARSLCSFSRRYYTGTGVAAGCGGTRTCPVGAPPVVVAFQQRLRELGRVESQNLTIEWRWAEGSLERFTTLVEEMVSLPVDVLVVPNQLTAQVAQQATTTIPTGGIAW
jgi:hypothetical protein